MKHLKLRRDIQLKGWIETLEEISKEFPDTKVPLDTAIKSFESQIKDLDLELNLE